MILALGWRKTMRRIAGLPFQSAGVTDVLDGIHYIAQVGNADRRSVHIGHYQGLVLFGLEKLVGGA